VLCIGLIVRTCMSAVYTLYSLQCAHGYAQCAHGYAHYKCARVYPERVHVCTLYCISVRISYVHARYTHSGISVCICIYICAYIFKYQACKLCTSTWYYMTGTCNTRHADCIIILYHYTVSLYCIIMHCRENSRQIKIKAQIKIVRHVVQAEHGRYKRPILSSKGLLFDFGSQYVLLTGVRWCYAGNSQMNYLSLLGPFCWFNYPYKVSGVVHYQMLLDGGFWEVFWWHFGFGISEVIYTCASRREVTQYICAS